MMQRDPAKGFFITFEGVEGTGKSTHVASLQERLLKEGCRVTTTREPGGTPLGEAVRDLVLRSHSPGPQAELFLMLAARADHVQHILTPRLNEGHVVLCDRFSHATWAYQGGGRGLPMKAVQDADRVATGGLSPDLVLLMDAPPGELADRLERRAVRRTLDRIDQEATVFFERVRSTYFNLAREDDRMVVIPTDRDRRRVAEDIWDAVEPVLRRKQSEGALA